MGNKHQLLRAFKNKLDNDIVDYDLLKNYLI